MGIVGMWVILVLAVSSLAVAGWMAYKRPWDEQIDTVNLIFSRFQAVALSLFAVGCVVLLLPDSLTDINSLMYHYAESASVYLAWMMVFLTAIDIFFIFKLFGGMTISKSFITTKLACIDKAVSFMATGIIGIGLILFSPLLTPKYLIIASIVMLASSVFLIASVFNHVSFIILKRDFQREVFENLQVQLRNHPNHYPWLRDTLCSSWDGISLKDVLPEKEKDKLLLFGKVRREAKRASGDASFFNLDMTAYKRELEIVDVTGMLGLIDVICDLGAYHPNRNKRASELGGIKLEILHDLIMQCNIFLSKTPKDKHKSDEFSFWLVMHGYRISEALLMKVLETADFELISTSIRSIYSIFLKNSANINRTLFGCEVMSEISIIHWMTDRISKNLYYHTGDGYLEDVDIENRMISFVSLIRICIGRLDKTLLRMSEEVLEDTALANKANDLLKLLIDTIHTLSLSGNEYHRKCSIALYFLAACFSRYRLSRIPPSKTRNRQIWLSLEEQTRFMIRYHIGNSRNKGLDFFRSYVYLMQFIEYNPIPIIPWKIRNYTFIEIQSIMDEIVDYFEKYLDFIEPTINPEEKHFITNNLVEPNWIFFDSPTITEEMLNVYLRDYESDGDKTPEGQNYSEFSRGWGYSALGTGTMYTQKSKKGITRILRKNS
ncbi:MAG TPA: hypothetical protein PKV16_06340 [Caldisericia bacterium]|nr:hypothetical protein [Caldisericia bacterium]HPF49192.1 hypothetical protein [Caldisericia bacterium]HPI84129.1 hypothetical protein [Caldisericia bacterium]HPQ93386.1 hypothetical protein [Caldisericia bacterium]HRV75232.1 hypothetical protein [Caldisericia bacterium]